jgi:thymidylate kinase
MNKIYFISGVCGVGKSTIIPYLKKLLPQNEYEVFDFDKRGVPENADRNWRISEAEYWIDESIKLADENKDTIVCGFIKPTDIPNKNDKIQISLILLDASPEIIHQRLEKRFTKNGIFDESQKVIGKPINEFIESNVYILELMRKIFKEKSCPIVDTSNLTPDEVAKEIMDIILQG